MKFTLTSRSDGPARVDEKLRAVIKQLCLGPVEKAPGCYKLSIVRREVERLKKEVDSKGRKQPPVIAVRTVIPDVTDNYGYDGKLNRYCFPCNQRGEFGLRKPPFHRVTYDSLVYLLPVLPAGKVRKGSAWSVDIPVYAGPAYFHPLGDGYKRGNQFKLSMAGRVESLYQRGGETFARLSWKCKGTFDTHLFNERFPPAYHNTRRIIHDVEGYGRALFNVTRGVVVTKSGQATATFTRQYRTVRVREKKGTDYKWDKSVDRHVIHYECRLLGEGEPDPQTSRKLR